MDNQHTGSGGGVDGVGGWHLRALTSTRHEPQLSGCNPPNCTAPVHNSCHITNPGK